MEIYVTALSGLFQSIFSRVSHKHTELVTIAILATCEVRGPKPQTLGLFQTYFNF